MVPSYDRKNIQTNKKVIRNKRKAQENQKKIKGKQREIKRKSKGGVQEFTEDSNRKIKQAIGTLNKQY